MRNVASAPGKVAASLSVFSFGERVYSIVSHHSNPIAQRLTMAHYTLVYFGVPGGGQAARVALAAVGAKVGHLCQLGNAPREVTNAPEGSRCDFRLFLSFFSLFPSLLTGFTVAEREC
jgi:hypothetical protein